MGMNITSRNYCIYFQWSIAWTIFISTFKMKENIAQIYSRKLEISNFNMCRNTILIALVPKYWVVWDNIKMCYIKFISIFCYVHNYRAFVSPSIHNIHGARHKINPMHGHKNSTSNYASDRYVICPFKHRSSYTMSFASERQRKMDAEWTAMMGRGLNKKCARLTGATKVGLHGEHPALGPPSLLFLGSYDVSLLRSMLHTPPWLTKILYVYSVYSE